MSRPESAASHHRPGSASASASNMMGGEMMGRVHTYSPTPSASSSHHQQIYYTPQEHYHPHGHVVYHHPHQQQFDPRGGHHQDMSGQMIMPYAGHQMAHGRIAIPMNGQPGGVMAINPNRAGKSQPQPIMRPVTPTSGFEDCGPSPFLPEDETTPYLPTHFDSYGSMTGSPSMGHMQLPPNHLVSPTDQINMSRMAPQLQRNHSMPMIGHPQQYASLPASRLQRGATRPNLNQRQTMPGSRPAPLQRHASLHGPPRSASPHIAGDIFDPVPPSANGSPMMRAQVHPQLQHQEMDLAYEYSAWDLASYGNNGQGISPARALGPAPMQPQRFSPHHDDLMITPQGNKTAYPNNVHSSATSSATDSSTVSSLSEASVRSVKQVNPLSFDSSDDENDSPTRGPSTSRAMRKMQLDEAKKASSAGPSRPPRPASSKPVIGGRTSAKFAKVAEDPGVEGVPPGPRPTDRPGPSFACIIGQAILRCKAGGLSLEHIYRYVETAYPYFKNGDGAWRNSVRHNLSIHKMFETIPRTEMFPPGKGGIWIIHEEEKCHWPAEDKFIKNFPASHPHHGVCRQTLHERQKEQEAMDKAAKEGKVYVPKKGKKGRKLNLKDEDDEAPEMTRSSSDMTLHQGASSQGLAPPSFHGEGSTTPKMLPKILHPPPLIDDDSNLLDFDDDDGEFLPMDSDEVDVLAPVDMTPMDPVRAQSDNLAKAGAMVPPRFERKEKKRPLHVDDENVFTSTKRVRMTEPLAPLHSIPQETIRDLDDSFITPEREKPMSNGKIMSSAFKTPALIQTSSSPGSSPMPQTITRTTHHPSALQQAWTRDDMTEANRSGGDGDSSPARPMLDAAFDFKPKSLHMRTRSLVNDDDYLPTSTTTPRPPKTPVTRSSAAHKTPRLHMRTPSLGNKNSSTTMTPMFFGHGSPALPPPSANALLSTPMWEMGGCLDRLKDHLTGSPTRGHSHGHSLGGHGIRSPMPPTSPTRYAMLLDSGASPRKRRDVSI